MANNVIVAWQNFLSEEGYQRVKEANKLSDVDSLNDPEEDPFRSKYKAREILSDVKEALKKYTEESSCLDTTDSVKIA
ncbi:hypothetical protein KUTeg_013665 [Tegillarca granosa]|uniref:Uncharacterized protein n=1 Tax=Tegillarca granosa TaxID=220873 RepID=A0ABQ9EWU3_TEGGR|nr:hypothetical protein KUTeg_013665 [Tegillarca granosa]